MPRSGSVSWCYCCWRRRSAGGPAPVPEDFVDATPGSGIDFRHVAFQTPKKYMLEIMGSGVALLDYDNDGRLDVFLVNGAPIADPTPLGTIPRKTSPEHWHRLYRQTPGGRFEDVTKKAGVQGVGYGLGAAAGDYDNDGNPDLYVTEYGGGNLLYHNNGNGTFTDVTDAFGNRRERVVQQRRLGGSGQRRTAGSCGFALRAVGLRRPALFCERESAGLLQPGRLQGDCASGVPQRRQWPIHRNLAEDRNLETGQGARHRAGRLRPGRLDRHLRRQ